MEVGVGEEAVEVVGPPADVLPYSGAFHVGRTPPWRYPYLCQSYWRTLAEGEGDLRIQIHHLHQLMGREGEEPSTLTPSLRLFVVAECWLTVAMEE